MDESNTHLITRNMTLQAQYLGDAVYMTTDDIQRIWLFTHNGVNVQAAICMEDFVIKNFHHSLEYFRNLEAFKEKAQQT